MTDLERQLEMLTARTAELEEQLEASHAQLSATQAELEAASQEINNLQVEIEKAEVSWFLNRQNVLPCVAFASTGPGTCSFSCTTQWEYPHRMTAQILRGHTSSHSSFTH